MEIEQKRIFFGLSPHVDYYHSYRGDSIGPAGFGHDLRTTAEILSQIEAVEPHRRQMILDQLRHRCHGGK